MADKVKVEKTNADRRIAWIDVETTGKTPRDGSRLLQVACIVTDGDLNELNEGFEMKIHYNAAEVARLFATSDDFVKNMHNKTGLWDALPTEGRPLAEVNEKLLAELKKYISDPVTAKIGGNSITLDRNFLEAELPEVFNFLHYRSYDMSSVAEHYKLNATNIPEYSKKYGHEALEDIRESIAEARYYSNILRGFTGLPKL
jgi:oligoribonuclease